MFGHSYKTSSTAPQESKNEEKKTSLFLQAAAEGDSQQIATYLNQGLPVDSACRFHWKDLKERPIYSDEQATALMVAAAYGHESVLKLLLEAGADIQDKDYRLVRTFNEAPPRLCAPLVLAASFGRLSIVKLLVQAKANIHGGNEAALRFPAINGHYDIVEFLLDQGAPAEHFFLSKNSSYYGYTVLMEVAALGKQSPEVARVVDLLLQRGAAATINNCDTDGMTALMFAHDPRVVQLLLTHGASVDEATNREIACGMSVDKYTALIMAINSNRQEKVKLLLQYKADPNLSDGLGRSPLDHAISSEHFHLVELLENYGAALISERSRRTLSERFSAQQAIRNDLSQTFQGKGQPDLANLILAYMNLYTPPQRIRAKKERSSEEEVSGSKKQKKEAKC